MSSVIHFIQFMSIVLLLTRIKKNMVTHRFARSFVQTIVYAVMTQKKTNSNHNNIESYSLFFISFKKRLLFSLAFFFPPRSLPSSPNSHSPSRLLSFKWRNDLPSIELPAFFHCFFLFWLQHIFITAYFTCILYIYATQYSVSMISLRINVLRRFVFAVSAAAAAAVVAVGFIRLF